MCQRNDVRRIGQVDRYGTTGLESCDRVRGKSYWCYATGSKESQTKSKRGHTEKLLARSFGSLNILYGPSELLMGL